MPNRGGSIHPYMGTNNRGDCMLDNIFGESRKDNGCEWMKITIPGRPVPAVRMTQRSKFVNKQAIRYLEYKKLIGWTAKANKIPKLDGEVEVKAIAYINGRQPDADNLAKAFLDGLNGIAYEDDRQVMRLTVEKVKVAKDEQRAEIEIKGME